MELNLYVNFLLFLVQKIGKNAKKSWSKAIRYQKLSNQIQIFVRPNFDQILPEIFTKFLQEFDQILTDLW